MLAAVLHGKEDVRLERLPMPAVGPGEVRVRIEAATTCGTDLKVYRRGYHARMITPPSVFGHEFAGIVDALGDGVDAWRVGDRVVAANSAPCGECFYCQRSRPELCEDLLFLNGAYAEYVTVPARIVHVNLLHVPAGMDLAAASLTEPLACAVHALEETEPASGDDVIVLGAGPLGLMLVRLAVLAGCRVLCAGRRAERLRLAERLGAEAVLDIDAGQDAAEWARAQCHGGRGPDCVIEAVGRTEAWETALEIARPGGTVNLFGGCPSGTRVPLDTGRMHYESLRVLGTFHHTPATVRQALALLASGDVPADVFIQERAALAELPDLLARLARGGGPLKVALTP